MSSLTTGWLSSQAYQIATEGIFGIWFKNQVLGSGFQEIPQHFPKMYVNKNPYQFLNRQNLTRSRCTTTFFPTTTTGATANPFQPEPPVSSEWFSGELLRVLDVLGIVLSSGSTAFAMPAPWEVGWWVDGSRWLMGEGKMWAG